MVSVQVAIAVGLPPFSPSTRRPLSCMGKAQVRGLIHFCYASCEVTYTIANPLWSATILMDNSTSLWHWCK